ncbi:hypothetical protein BKA66DRAFT_587912 [Pyrenochaeta sp. MPI-SDFR-AT-0127]|nr:hypothetical protein BKA66DRAFT_587912 [Pyrenochaeta sp. MPI-SDFR-AT-0127]
MVAPTEAQINYMVAHAYEDKRHGYIVASVIMLTAASVAFVLRFVSRRLGGVKLGVDDWYMVIGMFFTVVYITMLFVLLRFGMGRHVILVTDPRGFTIVRDKNHYHNNSHLRVQALITAEVSYAISICFIKMSILSLYNRIFPQPWFTRTSTAVAIFIILFTITKIGGDIFQCVPISSHWTGEPATCIQFSKLVIVHGVLNILTDFIIVGLPLPILWNLNLTRLKKWGLTFMLTTGLFVCIISTVRLPIVKHVDTPDPSWDFVSPLTISAIELCAAVIAACIPTYRPFFNLVVNGDPNRDTKATSSHGVSGKSSDSSFPSQQIPLSDIPNTDIHGGISPRPESIGYTHLDETSCEKLNQNKIFVTKSFSYNASPV